MTFRYDQDFEFIDAIANGRPCRPSFREGAMAQAVMDAAHAVRQATRLGGRFAGLSDVPAPLVSVWPASLLAVNRAG